MLLINSAECNLLAEFLIFLVLVAAFYTPVLYVNQNKHILESKTKTSSNYKLPVLPAFPEYTLEKGFNFFFAIRPELSF